MEYDIKMSSIFPLQNPNYPNQPNLTTTKKNVSKIIITNHQNFPMKNIKSHRSPLNIYPVDFDMHGGGEGEGRSEAIVTTQRFTILSYDRPMNDL